MLSRSKHQQNTPMSGNAGESSPRKDDKDNHSRLLPTTVQIAQSFAIRGFDVPKLLQKLDIQLSSSSLKTPPHLVELNFTEPLLWDVATAGTLV